MAWNAVLQPYRTGSPPLLDAAFMARYGNRAWAPVGDDKHAAAKLHTQLVSRISTQRLPYRDGVEKAALDSLYALFETTRQICDKHPDGHHFDALVWHVLNTHLRPFTAKWHRERESLGALDATDHFRAELRALQVHLIEFDRLLLHLRDDEEPPRIEPAISSLQAEIVSEMQAPVACEIRETFSGIAHTDLQARKDQIEAINTAERAAIARRRAHYGITGTTGAAALALSGGGIRSATFSLGVLIALAERGLLRHFDYLSSVSGGGYLGSFISTFLQSRVANVGLNADELPFRRIEGEAAALRHIRHHAKYLSMGSIWERLKALTAQLYGMVLNGLAVIWVVLLIAVVERWLTTTTRVSEIASWWRPALGLLAIGAALSLLLLRFRRSQRYADELIFWPAAAIATVAAAVGLGALRSWLQHAAVGTTTIGDATAWVTALGAAPAVSPVVEALAPRLFARLGLVLTTLSAIAAPLFVLALYLYVSSIDGLTAIGSTYFGVFVPHALLVLAVGGLVYLLLFDVNMTSPHRHYRRKLGEAYLIQPVNAKADTFQTDVSVRLSDLTSARAPYHLINCALNVPSSANANMQGRLTDFFLFSPAFCGSSLIGYRPTPEWEARDPHLDVGTAMAISGAAASPQMGTGTIAGVRFWLALLNVRLGYWARQPHVRPWMRGRPGIRYLLKEMLGSMHERSRFINLSDGGHIENLGVYELLRRRCKFIVAIDGEEDPRMTFHGLTTLQRLAAIDLGVQIDIDVDDLRLNDRGLSRSHFRFCRIRYPRGTRGSLDDFGYLLYVKLSLTGNEGEFIRRYRLDEPVFPHHSIADQFFSETQFEAYRSLGEHVGSKLFLEAIVGSLAAQQDIPLEAWFQELGKSLLSRADRTR